MARLNSPPKMDLRWKYAVGDHVIAMSWSPDSFGLACATVSGKLFVFDVNTGNLRFEIEAHQFGLQDIAWHPKGKMIATAGQDGKVRIWDSNKGEKLNELEAGSAWVERVRWNSKGDYLVSAAGKKLKLWNQAGEIIHNYPDFASTISDVAWSPRGKEFVATGYGGVSFYRPDAEGIVNQFEWKGSILAIAWSPDGKMLAGGGQDASVHFWYVKSGEDLQMTGYPTKIRELAWDPESRFMATGGGEQVIVWDCSGEGPAGSKPIMCELHQSIISALAYQNKGPLLASACPDGLIGLWYPGGSKKVMGKSEFGEGISKLAFSPLDNKLAVGGEINSVGVYVV